eukprot:CAMPEP_0115156552 /NCGR_PEP_ID=MMETSP0227-20121206/68512_1 /TAXON_ID=89957 /ORGANISM="Polarella glacialis, Strain CCMP 1383" /LENGTH=339 /DNA_ID=CAMNT_0002567749 /DNA_START=27 /DNA_END=1046 /DNA_ORIENTATION=-
MASRTLVAGSIILGASSCLACDAFVQTPLALKKDTQRAPCTAALRGAAAPEVSSSVLAGTALPVAGVAGTVALVVAFADRRRMLRQSTARKAVQDKKTSAKPVQSGGVDGLEGEPGVKPSAEVASSSKALPPKFSQTDVQKKKVFAGGLTGGQSPFGSFDFNFDPLELTTKFPAAIPWFRESEVKHGRIAMLAFVGLLGEEFAGPFPGWLPEKCALAGVNREPLANLRIQDAHDLCVEAHMPMFADLSPMMIILIASGTIEIVTTAQKLALGWGLTIENAGEYPGRAEIGGFLKQLPADQAAFDLIKLSELKHCRLAMIGFGGAITQAVLCANGFPWIF